MFDQSRDLKCEIKYLKEYNEKLEQHNKELRERIKLLESGTCCDGKWCDHCEFHGGDELVFENGVIKRTRTVCLKNVPCPDFVRREAAKPHD